MLCPIKLNSNTIELTVHASCYWVLDLLCITVSENCIVVPFKFGTPKILKFGSCKF